MLGDAAGVCLFPSGIKLPARARVARTQPIYLGNGTFAIGRYRGLYTVELTKALLNIPRRLVVDSSRIRVMFNHNATQPSLRVSISCKPRSHIAWRSGRGVSHNPLLASLQTQCKVAVKPERVVLYRHEGHLPLRELGRVAQHSVCRRKC